MKNEDKRGNLGKNNGDIVNKRREANMTFFKFIELFPTEDKAIEYFINIRYKGLLTCPHCGSIDQVYRYKGNLKLVQCHHCNNSFSPFTDTIFYKTHIDMRKWFYAIHLFLNDKKGVSACNLRREIDNAKGTGKISYKAAFRMLHKIREAMGNTSVRKDFEGFVEIDETYLGGKNKGSKRGRGTDKTPIVGIKERSSGRVYAQVMLPNEKGQQLTGKQLLSVLDKICKDETIVCTDEFKGYDILDKSHKNKFIRLSVNHSAKEFARGDVHTNGMENFFWLFKKGFYGTYHKMSVKHMQKYVDEFCFRVSNRKNQDIFNTLLNQGILVKAS